MGHLRRLDIQWDPDHEIKLILDELAGSITDRQEYGEAKYWNACILIKSSFLSFFLECWVFIIISYYYY